jgi:hypothetical protein
VDDTDLIQSQLQESADHAMSLPQQAINTWEVSLKATCGALVPEKTAWWLVSFQWNGTTWSYASIQDSPGDLYVNDISNNRKVITRLEPHQAYETLGVYLAPLGNLEQQFIKMKSAATQWADNLRTGNIGRSEVWIALQSTILRTLMYPFPALRMTKQQLEHIMAPILRYCLPALGICRNFPRQLVFSKLEYMGIDIPHLFFIQEIARIKDIIFHSFNDTLSGRLYTTSMELLFIEVGLDPQQHINDCTIIDALATPSLFKATMLFLATYTIQLKHSISIQPQREFDQFIMAKLILSKAPLPDLIICNQCRLFLQACLVSDLATGNGLSISEEAWAGTGQRNSLKNSSWPFIPRPTRSSWAIWQKWIKIALLGRGRRL